MSNTSNNKTVNKPTKNKDKDKLRVIVGEIGRDSKTGILGRGYSSDNGKTFHVTDTMYGRLYDPNDIEGIWNGGTADKVKKEVDSATAEIPAAVSAANSAVSAAESAVAASKVNSDAIVAQSEAISEAKAAMDSATAEIQQTAANAASDAAKIRADVAQVQNEVDTAKTANSASVEALKSDVSAAKQDLSDVHDSLDKAQSAIEQNQKLINDNVAKITSDVSATKQDLADVHDSLTKAQAAAEQNQEAIDKSIAQINDSIDSTNQDLAGVRKDLTQAQSDITANQKSINDSVAQINADITQDRKDIASAQQANAGTAKQLDTYSKQAAEQGKTIKSIQDKQDGFTATLADVQGNVTQVSDKVDGLSANLKDAQDNVASVKAQADQLSATLTDHAKSIATLTASAKELSSTLEDADGRLSKVEQTAKTNSSTLADVQGDLSQVKQDATTLTSTLKDAQGNISTLQQKADSVSAQLATAQGDIATLQTGVAGVKATLASHDKSIHTLQVDSKSLKDSMADAQGDISTLSKTATSLDSVMKDHAGRLSKVEQSAATQATTLSDLQGNLTQVKQQADGLVTTLKDAQGSITQIQQKADGTLAQLKSAQGDIASLQTDVTGIKATLTDHEGNIHTLQADSKSLRDDMTDAQGNISSLQKSSTKLDSEMSSQDGRLSKVEQTAKEHTSTISDLGDKLNDKDGINLLKGTADFKPDNLWVCLTFWQKAADKYNDLTVYKTSVDWYGLAQYYPVKKGETYTFSLNARYESGTGRSVIWIMLNNDPEGSYNLANVNNASKMVDLNETWQRVSIVFTATSNGYIKPRMERGVDNKNVLEVCGFKLEHGSVATPWTPAPEDMATVTQVKQTADGIETTLKSAQGDIDQIKQTAKGTSEQLSNVQGDVTNIQKDVNGLKQTTADNAGNIHTLQSDSKTLKDDMQDAQGDISTLKKTSTDVTSELKDHAGRISKTEQTASTLVNEFADQQGHLNRVEQTAQGTQQTVANQQGQINNIKTDASGIHETLTGQGNQIANINVTLNGLNTKYEGVSGDLGKLSDKITTNTTQIAQNQQAIALKADQATVNNLSGQVSQAQAQLKVQADQISSKVSSTDFKTLNDKVNGMQIGGRNLLKGTRSWQGDWKHVTPSSIDEVKYNGLDVWKTTTAWDAPHQSYDAKPNATYTFSFYAKASEAGNIMDIFTLEAEDWKSPVVSVPVYANRAITTDWQRYSITFTTKDGGQICTDACSTKDGVVLYLAGYKLEFGNVATDWTPAPEDLTTAIQKNSTAIDQTNKQISLKADQTEVDQVKNTATQNSSRLNVMAGEISSKVTSTDVNNIVDGKGYATTSTVQSLITQKAGTINESITNLDAKYRAKDGVNLATGTGNVNASGGYGTNGNIGGISLDTINDLRGKHITISVDVEWKGWKSGNQNRIGYELQINYDDGSVEYDGSWLTPTTTDGKQRITATYKLKDQHIKSLGEGYAYVQINCTSAKISHLKIERGTVATPWTPAPIDNATVTQVQEITASIDGLQSTVANKADKSQITQLSNMIQSKVSSSDFNDLKDKTTWKSTDSIDLNTAVSQQKIFVKGGSNLPPGTYWWYVQVESGYDSRIVQYAVSDRDNKQYRRQYDGSKWSAWSQGATESEITQLRDDINLRVKSGDLLSQINIQAGQTLIQSKKLYLADDSVIFSNKAFIPSAAIVNLDASKLTFYGSDGTYATMGSSVKQYDQDKLKSTINLQYNGGVEVHASNELGSILTMHDDTIRLAVKSQVYGSGSGQALDQQYSGFWAGSNYALMNSVDSEGNTTGISIGSGGNVNGQYRFSVYDNSKSNQSVFGTRFQTQRFDVYAGSSALYLGPTKAELWGSDYAKLNGGSEQIYMHDGEIVMGNPNDLANNKALHLIVSGWADFKGWVNVMGLTQTSLLSTKTRIEPLNTAYALQKINEADVETYQFKTDVADGQTKRHTSVVIDDVHDVAQYSTPEEFISENRQGRDDGDIIGFLMGAVQELTKQVNQLKKEAKQ